MGEGSKLEMCAGLIPSGAESFMHVGEGNLICFQKLKYFLRIEKILPIGSIQFKIVVKRIVCGCSHLNRESK